ncbi:DEAD/DEAH box helicase [Thalassorhabdomicrobium marinisediminis]|uniref:Helicase n=1 Tax=Thalassorhabdomicrobium marinisediminis TaxID=2170577 RepID=A0A2T7FU30_9RHOB|nr:DEAD/DEAH box helicase [Thalassorhabdomicrobium marinisediminis]PVA05678.1 helicase [Thalassorhabdomicrobium marinisediminis]
MYDERTADLIRSAPDLPGLDRNRLPEQLSQAFAEIVSARIALRDTETPAGDISETIAFARKLAATNEVLVTTSPERENRRAASFVAASAHQLVHQAEALLGLASRTTTFTADAISSDVSAMLLFLIAGSSADATEVARALRSPAEDRLQHELVLNLGWLARGMIGPILNQERTPVTEMITGEGVDGTRAARALYHRLLEGVRALAAVLGGIPDADRERPAAVFRGVAKAAKPDDAIAIGGLPPMLVASFPGPFHLARLLEAASSALLEAAVINIDPPDGVPADRWHHSMARIAKKRPYLWSNHLAAIKAGYLKPGTSCAVGFPTGAGKSTTAQLKIHAALLRDLKVVFLAPTHALVDQTARDLRAAFPNTSVKGQRADEFEEGTLLEELPDILVMTPEACLYASHIEPESFADVGLLIFDECHLIHPKTDGDRRAIDAMLCLIRVTKVAPEADLVLLSAMMKNTGEIAEWLEELTGRRSIPLDDVWKPTRQLRGCVVYQADAIKRLDEKIEDAWQNRKTKGPPVALNRELHAAPLGLFSLKQTWASKRRDEYALLSLLGHEVLLTTNKKWRLTPNSGELASHIAASAAKAGLRTLVFSQSIPNAWSIAKKASGIIDAPPTELTTAEMGLYETVVDEMGGAGDVYLAVENGALQSAATAHHGLLLPYERDLAERLYGRDDGLRVLAATPTLAQGMNLPADLVIIAEDSRFDRETNRRDLLDAAALLNAAGRAGRAGQSASGIVLIVPGKVVPLSDEEGTIGEQWTQLREVFSQSDQCLVLEDPFEAVMDRVHHKAEDAGDLERYVVSRLMETPSGGEDGGSPRVDLSRSLTAFLKRKAGDEQWVASRTEAALSVMSGADEDAVVLDQRYRDLASMVGLPEDVLKALSDALADAHDDMASTVAGICEWMFSWMEANPGHLFRMIKPSTFEDLFGKTYGDLASDEEKARYAVPKLEATLRQWMDGAPLKEIQQTISPNGASAEFSPDARKFVIRMIPDLAHVMGLPSRMMQIFTPGGSEPNTVEGAGPLLLAHVCVRRGLRDAEMAAFSMSGGALPRRATHRAFDEVRPHVAAAESGETLENLKERVRAGKELKQAIEAFSNIDLGPFDSTQL